MLDLKPIKARLDKASPGPWRTLAGARRVSIRDVWPAPSVAVANPLVLGNDEYVIGEISPWIEDVDRDFIVHARTDVESLYDELRTAREHLRAVLCDCDEQAVAAARAYLDLTPVGSGGCP
jgi:hypothetical protein